MLTIRDLQSQEQFAVPPEGAVLGREGGGADIVVRDKSVSKRHAKVYERGGKWFLEDLQSANGTYVDEQPVTRPVNMKPGMSFSLSNYHFEVMAPEANVGGSRPRKEAAPPADDWGDADGGYPDETAPPPDDEWAPEVSDRGNRTGPGGKKPPGGAAKSNGSSRGSAAKGSAAKKPSASSSGNRDVDDAAGGVVAQIPKAIAYYLKNVPLLAVNPVGYIKGSIEDMKFPAMKPLELLPWGLVAALFQTGIGIGAGAIALITSMIQTKQFAIGGIIGLFVGAAVGAVIAVVVAIVSAFIFHWLVGLIIRLLKGESDDLNRSNYYVCVMTANVLMGLPAAAVGISSVFALIPVVGKFGAVLPLLAGIIGQFYMLLVSYFWLKYFQVMKWVPIVILVLAVLNVVNGARGVVGVIRAGVAGGVGGATAGLTAEQQAAIAAAQAAGGTGGIETPTMGGSDATPKPTDGGSSSSSTPIPAGTAVAMATRPGATATPKPGTSGNPGVAVAPIAGGLTPYQRWAAKRDAVEKAVADDPTILRSNKDFLAAYQQYHKVAYGVRQKYAKIRKDPALEPVAVRMIDAETFEQTGPLMDQLYGRISR